MARTARKWRVGPREAASMVEGRDVGYDELEDAMPEIDAHDALETVHRGMAAYDRDTTKGKTCPFPRDVVRWYEDLKSASFRDADRPDQALEDEWSAVDASEADRG